MSDNQENNNNENNNNQNNNNQKSNVAGIVTVLVVLFVIIAIFIFLFAKLIKFVEKKKFSDDFKDMANNAVQQIEQKTYDSQLESLTEELVGVLEDEDTYVQYDIYNGASSPMLTKSGTLKLTVSTKQPYIMRPSTNSYPGS